VPGIQDLAVKIGTLTGASYTRQGS